MELLLDKVFKWSWSHDKDGCHAHINKWVHEPIWISKVKVIHWPWSKDTQDSTFSNFISLETLRLIEARFHVEPPWDGGTKVCPNGSGHMTKMATMPIYDKNLKKSSLEPKGRWPWNLVCSIGLEYYQIFSNDDPALTLTYFTASQIWSLMLLYWKKVKRWIFSETIVDYDIKVAVNQMSTWSFMNIKSRSFIDLSPRSLRFNIFRLLFLRNP